MRGGDVEAVEGCGGGKMRGEVEEEDAGAGADVCDVRVWGEAGCYGGVQDVADVSGGG